MTQHIYNIINIPNNKWKQNANKKEAKEGKTRSSNRTRLFGEFLCHTPPPSRCVRTFHFLALLCSKLIIIIYKKKHYTYYTQCYKNIENGVLQVTSLFATFSNAYSLNKLWNCSALRIHIILCHSFFCAFSLPQTW